MASTSNRFLPTCILMCGGRGNRLFPLTPSLPRPLLPVASRPLIAFQLDLLEASGVTEVHAVCQAGQVAEEVRRYVTEVYMGRIECEVIAIDTSEYEGTADALRAPEVRQVIEEGGPEFMLVAGDVVCDVTLHGLVDLHRTTEASLTVLLARSPPLSRASGHGKGSKAEEDLNSTVVVDPETGRLVSVVSAMDVSDAGALMLPRSALQRFPNTHLRTDLADLHVYVFSAWVLDVLDARPEFCSVSEDLVRFLVEHQFECALNGKQEKRYLPPSAPTSESIESDLAIKFSSTTKRGRSADPVRCFAHILYDVDHAKASGPISPRAAIEAPAAPKGVAMRCNTVPKYFELNRLVALSQDRLSPWLLRAMKVNHISGASNNKDGSTGSGGGGGNDQSTSIASSSGSSSSNASSASNSSASSSNSSSAAAGGVTVVPSTTHSGRRDSTSEDQNPAQIGSDCHVGSDVEVSSGSIVKKSVVGSHCRIGQGVRIVNSIVHDHVTVEDGVTISGSVVSRGSTVKRRSNLVDCRVAAWQEVPENTQKKGEVFSSGIENI